MTLITILLLPAIIWQGQIVDAVSNEPVPYVEIRVLPDGITTLTDSTGSFTIQFDQSPGPLTVQAQRIGYRSRVWQNVSPDRPVKFTLLPAAIPVAGATSTASRLRKKPLPALPLTVITSTRLTDGSPLPELLSQSPGTMVNNYANLFTVALRGTNTEHTLIMLDGVPLNSSLNGSSDLTLLPAELISGLEIARGGASALYGTSSVGGVINFILPEPEKKELALRLGLGSFGERTVSTRFSLPAGNHSRLPLTGGAEFFRIANNYPFVGTDDSLRYRQNADLTRSAGFLKSGVSIAANQSLPLLVHFTTATRGSPGPVSFPSESARLNDTRLLLVTGYDLILNEHHRSSARLHHQRQFQNYYNPDPYFTAADTHQTERTGITLNQRLHFTGPEAITHDWLLGVEGSLEKAKSTAVGTPGRTTLAGYLESGFNWQFLNLNPALRYELLRNLNPGSGTGSRTFGAFSYRLLLGFNPVPVLSFYLSAHRSFRAPGFNELFWPEDPWTRGNPRLQPEWATGYDAGVAILNANSGLIRINGFVNRLENLIQWLPDSNFVYQPVNIERAQITGLELEPNLNIGLFGIKGNLTVQQCRTDTTILPYRPQLSGRLVTWIDWGKSPLPAFRLLIGAGGASRRFTNRANTDTLPGYFSIDLGLESRFALKKLNIGVATGCQNLLDRSYETIRDYPLPGRSLYLKTELKI
jgi:outer membrane cobalamin receptor